jgi:hypothetical protein
MSAMQRDADDPMNPNLEGGPPGREWIPPRPDPRITRRKNPIIAAVLSLMPGLGQVYVGHYQRGFVHLFVLAGVITILASRNAGGATPLLGLFVAFFWMYNLIDAARLATFYNEALDGVSPAELRREAVLPKRGGSILAGAALIVGGMLILLNRVYGVPMDWLEDWWPIAPVGLGVYLLVQGIRERRAR